MELVRLFIEREDFNNCTGWEIYNISIGPMYFIASVSEYFGPKGLFYHFLLKDTFEEYVAADKTEEYAKYYLRKMLDILEYKINNKS